jgi:glutamate---cysteine ligase / carboxylate-amine ligase
MHEAAVAAEHSSFERAPRWADWQPSTPYSVGLEEEVMLLDPDTWTLAQRADAVLALIGDDLAQHCSAETHEAALELNTGPHATVGAAIAELRGLRAGLARDARDLGLATAVAGMHPAQMAEDPRVPRAGRYQLVHRTMRGIARREPTFALHVHIGVADSEHAIRLLNHLRAHLPLFLALSASSPLWRGRTTGWPRTGRSSFRPSRAPACRGTSRLRRLGAHRRTARAPGRGPGADLPLVGRASAAPLRHR